MYPWLAGRIFQKGYKEGSSEEEVSNLIKKQLSDTRARLKKNMGNMGKSLGCIRNNRGCDGLNLGKQLAKTPAINMDDIFAKKDIKSMSEEELKALTPEQRRDLRKSTLAGNYFEEVQCRQRIREDVAEVRKELGYLALDVGLTFATVGLTSAAILGKLFAKVGSISKSQMMQNLALAGVDITFSIPYMNEAVDQCGKSMNQLERLASKAEGSSDVCESLSVRSKHTSDLKSCVLMAGLASLPITLPFLGATGRAVVKGVQRKGAPQKASRKALAESNIGRSINDEQARAVERAHLVGKGETGKDGTPAGIDNYTSDQLKEKIRILREAGFTLSERRQLVEGGVVGKKHLKWPEWFEESIISAEGVPWHYRVSGSSLPAETKLIEKLEKRWPVLIERLRNKNYEYNDYIIEMLVHPTYTMKVKPEQALLGYLNICT